MTNDQIETCDDLWREALEVGLVRWMPGMVTASGKIIAQGRDLPLKIHTSVGPARVSPANVRLDWSHPCNLGWLLALAREATACQTHSASHYAQLDAWAYDWNRTDGTPVDGTLSMTEPEALLRAILATRSK